MRKMGWLDDNSISQLGYEVYLTVLTVMGVNSIFGSPKRKQKLTTQLDMLLTEKLLVFNKKTKKFEFGNSMPGYFIVLILAMQDKAIPKIN
jgi:hypothetical protein